MPSASGRRPNDRSHNRSPITATSGAVVETSAAGLNNYWHNEFLPETAQPQPKPPKPKPKPLKHEPPKPPKHEPPKPAKLTPLLNPTPMSPGTGTTW